MANTALVEQSTLPVMNCWYTKGDGKLITPPYGYAGGTFFNPMNTAPDGHSYSDTEWTVFMQLYLQYIFFKLFMTDQGYTYPPVNYRDGYSVIRIGTAHDGAAVLYA